MIIDLCQVVCDIALDSRVKSSRMPQSALDLIERVVFVRGRIDVMSGEELVRRQFLVEGDKALDVCNDVLAWLVASEAGRVERG